MKIRVTNLSGLNGIPPCLLEYEGKVIAFRGGHVSFEVSMIPQVMEKWAASGVAVIRDLANGEVVAGTSADELPAIPKIQEATGANDLDALDEDEVDLMAEMANAKEAQLPTQSAGIMGNTRQVRTAKVSLGSRVGDEVINPAISPIPGDRPVSVDESDAFTIRAPRVTGPGAIASRD